MPYSMQKTYFSMRRRTVGLPSLLIGLIALLLVSSLLPYGLAANYTVSYQLLDQPNGSTHYRLNVTVPQSLHEYYVAKSHTSNTENDFVKFVTPYALKPIADSLRQIYTDDEDFTNGALMIVHQIPYEVTTPAKYPVETIVDNKGDCDLFSFIAASIIKASGLDVVLLYYEQAAHMNIGISLQNAPQHARGNIFSVMNNNIKYYVAECTGGNWQDGWRVGECPDELKNAHPQVITVEDSGQSATGQVSASYKSLSTSSLTLTASPSFLIQGSIVTFSGQLLPNLPNENITVYIRTSNSPWTVLDTATTDSNGQFSYSWNVETGGTCNIRASWSGNDDYAVTDSPTQTITSLSTFVILLLTVTGMLVAVGTATYLISKANRQGPLEPQPPEIPS